MEWKEILFDDFCRLNRGFDLPNEKIVEGKVPVVASSSIKAFHNVSKVKAPGVVTGRSGTLGIVQYIEQDYWPLNTSLYVKDFKGNNPKFCYYFLQMMHLENFNAGAGVPTLNQNHLHKLKIKVPSTYQEQEKVASILSDYDTLIDINTKRIKLLEETARELYKEWFVRMRFPGHEQTKFVKGIPKGWIISTLQDFGRIETGKTPSMERAEYYEGDYLFIKTPDMHNSMFVINSTETLSEAGNNCQKKKLLPVNSIMVSCIGSTGVGEVAINAKKAHTNQQINSIILHNQEWLYWLYFTCESLKPTIEMYGATGSTMINLSKGKFENLKVVKPTNAIVEQFNKVESPLFEEIKNLQLQNHNLAATHDRLLPRLLSGELKVET